MTGEKVKNWIGGESPNRRSEEWEIFGFSTPFPLTSGRADGKMAQTKYRVERKEYLLRNLREPGSPAESPGGGSAGKVRPGAKKAQKSDK